MQLKAFGKRLRESRAPLPEPNLEDWLDGRVDDPEKAPVFKPVIVREVKIEEASDLCEADLLGDEDVLGFLEEAPGAESEAAGIGGVKVALRLERLHEIRANLEAWRDRAWETWARDERPVRKSIQLYNALFKLHNMLHGGAAATPPELVWGIGLARWKLPTAEIDIPLIEQLVDLEVQAQGDLVIRPRDVRPSVVMRAFLHLDVEGSGNTQHEAQELFAKITENDEQPVTPFDSVGWEPLLDLVAGRLSGAGRHITRHVLDDGAEVKAPETELAVYSTWAIYGRPRSENLREQDLERLREKIDSVEDDSKLPPSMRGYVGQAPDPQDSDANGWGVMIGGSGQGCGSSGGTGGGGSGKDGDPPRHTYFFPLPYNEEQAQIIDRLESEEVQVVSVTGPPGTGKTHSIANIIGHFMATGRRVLVTARTSEAIAAVRDKLPPELASLVIASVASDREGVKQMEDAIQHLSDDVVSLSVKDTRDDIARLRNQVLEIDTESHQCDQRLAQIAKRNLEPLTWADEKRTSMEMAEILADLEPKHSWMEDRPRRAPPAGIDLAIERLRSALPRLGEDLIYLGAELPEPSEIPFAADLIEAHSREKAHRQKPREDFSGEPQMARDTSDAEAIAEACQMALSELRATLAEAAEWERSLVRALVQARLYEQSEPVTEECVEAVWMLIGEGRLAPGRLS